MASERSFLYWIRWAVAAETVLLLVQFELGEWLTIFGDFPAARMRGFSLDVFASNVSATGPALIAHATVGVLILAVAVTVFILSLRVRVRRLWMASGLGLLFAASAATGGFLFVVQGFAGDRSLFLMGSSFIAALAATGYSLYLVWTYGSTAPVPEEPVGTAGKPGSGP